MVPTVESIEKLKLISNKEKKEDKIHLQIYTKTVRQHFANFWKISFGGFEKQLKLLKVK